MNRNIEKHGNFYSIGNRGNKLKTTVEPNFNTFFNEQIKFYEPSSNIYKYIFIRLDFFTIS